MCAILLAALAPSISHALAAADGKSSFWMEICSVNGMKLVKADGVPSHAPAKHATNGEHCPFCAPGHVAALPPSASFVLPALDGRATRPTLFYHAPRPLFVWTSAQSRAPPFHS